MRICWCLDAEISRSSATILSNPSIKRFFACAERTPQLCVQIECLYLHNYSRWRYTQPFRNYSMTTELQVQIWIDGYCMRLAASYHYLVCSLLNNDCCRRFQWWLFCSALRLREFTHTHAHKLPLEWPDVDHFERFYQWQKDSSGIYFFTLDSCLPTQHRIQARTDIATEIKFI